MDGVCDRIINPFRGGDVCTNFEEGRYTPCERHDGFLVLLLALTFPLGRGFRGGCFCLGGFDGRL